MKSWFIAIYLIVQVLLFVLFYYLYNSIFDGNFIKSFAALVPIILLIGYILYNFLIEPKEAQDRVLEHLIKETLHEINLPISTIMANSKMVKKALNSEKDLKRLSRIEDATNRLNRLYMQLNYNIKKEIMPIEKERVSLDKLLEERVAIFKEYNRNIFNLELSNLEIFVDKIGLEQVIDNIIENAMKYSKKEEPIYIKLDKTKLYIVDRGVGIEQDELSLIYQRYYQESQSNQGEGIGLNIVKSYCDSNEIALKIESKKGVGTNVILDFKRVKFKQ